MTTEPSQTPPSPTAPQTPPTTRANPYVGPRTYAPEQSHLFFGREREARDLLDLVVANRVVLLFAQSGAGKSSLINARLMPGLRGKKFEVLPVGRVGGEPPTGWAVDNIYAYNLMVTLDETNVDDWRFARLKLSNFLTSLAWIDGKWRYQPEGGLPGDPTAGAADVDLDALDIRPRALIIDQFEELLTTNPDKWPQRAEFFDQLHQAMEDDPFLWVILSVREDYIAALSPFAYQLPGQLRARYYMQRMEADAALEAVREPARLGGRPFAEGIAEELVRNLRQMLMPGQTETQPGQFVEPVQLQVVCFRLWEKLQDRPLCPINRADLESAGDVDTALADYYQDSIQAVLHDPTVEVSERALRDWFSHELITEAGTRGFVRQGSKTTGSLPNDVVARLQRSYILRSEERAASKWFELVHDRFIEPIRRSNERWREQFLLLDPVALAASTWDGAGRPDTLLFGGSQLGQALATTDLAAADREVKDFLERSEDVEKRRALEALSRSEAAALEKAATEKRNRIRLTRLAVALAFFVVMAGIATAVAFQAMQQARQDQMEAEASGTREAHARETAVLAKETAIAAQATAVWNEEAATQKAGELNSALLEVQSLDMADQARTAVQNGETTFATLLSVEAIDRASTTAAQGALLGALFQDTSSPFLPNYDTDRLAHPDIGELRRIAATGPDAAARRLAISGDLGKIVLWQDPNGALAPAVLDAHPYPIRALAFSPDGGTLASASGAWGTTYDGSEAGDPNHAIILWDVTQTPPVSRTLASRLGSVWDISFDPDGSRLATGNADGTITLWSLDGTEPVSRTLRGAHGDWVWSVAFSPDGASLASGGKDGLIALWSDLDSTEPAFQPLEGHAEWVNAVSFSPDGRALVSASDDATVRVWYPGNTPIDSRELLGHAASVARAVFSPDGKTIASASYDNSVRLWNAQTGHLVAIVQQHLAGARDVIFLPDQPNILLSVDDDGLVVRSDLSQQAVLGRRLPSTIPTARQVMFPATQDRLIVAGADRIAEWQAIMQDLPVSQTIPLPQDTGVLTAAMASAARDSLLLADSGGNFWQLKLDASGGVGAPRDSGLVVQSIGLSADGSKLAAAGCVRAKTSDEGCQERVIRLWNAASDQTEPDRTIPVDAESVNRLTLSPDGTLLAAAMDNSVTLYDLSESDLTSKVLGASERLIMDLQFSPDGALLASQDISGTIGLWNMRSATPSEVQLSEPGYGTLAAAIDFSADSSLLASIGCRLENPADSRSKCVGTDLQLWDLASRKPIGAPVPVGETAELELSEDAGDIVPDVAFHPSQQLVAVLAADGSIALLRTGVDTWRQMACAQAGRNLTYSEWIRAFQREEDRTENPLTCTTPPFDYPFDLSFATAKVDQATKLLERCQSDDSAESLKLLRQAVAMTTTEQLEMDPQEAMLDLLEKQAQTYTLDNRSELARRCYTLLNSYLPANRQIAVDAILPTGEQIAEGIAYTRQYEYAEALRALEAARAGWSAAPEYLQRHLIDAYLTLCRTGTVTGSAEAELACNRLTELSPLTAGRPVSGELEEEGSRLWVVEGKRGDLLTIDVTGSDPWFDPYLSVTDLADHQLTMDEDSGLNWYPRVRDLILPSDGMVVIRLIARNPGGAYTLFLSKTLPVAMTPGEPVSSSSLDQTAWSFAGKTGQIVSVSAENTSPDYYPTLTLVGPDGTVLDSRFNNSGMAKVAIRDVRLQDDGTYLVKVGGNADGSYNLLVKQTTPKALAFDDRQTVSTDEQTLWSFEGQAGQVISIDLRGISTEFPPALSLLRPDYRVVTGANSLAEQRATLHGINLPEDGTYLIKVDGDSGDYSLELTAETPATLPAVGLQASNTTTQTLWTFDGLVNEIVTIRMIATTGDLVPAFALVGPDGQVLANADQPVDGASTEISDIVLRAAGPHRIRIEGSGDGAYLIARESKSADSLEALIPSQPQSGSTNEQRVWAYDGKAGQAFSLDVTAALGSFNAELSLYGPDGLLLAYGNPSGDGANARIPPIVASQDGRYVVRVDGDGNYLLKVSEETPKALTIGTPQPVSFGGETLFLFDGAAGQARTVVLTSTFDVISPDLSVVGPDGLSVVYGSAYDNQSARTESIILPRDGSYLVRIVGPMDGLVALIEPEHYALPFEQLQVSSTREKSLWSFHGQAGEIVTISLSGASTRYDPRLSLLAVDGSVIADSDDSGTGYGGYDSLIQRAVLPATGLYYVQVGRPNSTEPYALLLSKALPQPASFEAPFDAPKDSAWAFAAQEGQLIRVAFTQQDLQNPTLKLALAGPNGEILGTSTQALLLPLRATGTYRLVVQGLRADAGVESVLLNAADAGAEPVLLNAVDTPLRAITETARAELAPGATDYWSFPGDAGQSITLTFSSQALPADLELYAPGGALIQRQDTAESPDLTSALPLAGTYILAVRADDDRSGGGYSIALGRGSTAPIPQQCGAQPDGVDYGPVRPGSRVLLGEHRPVNDVKNGSVQAMERYVGLVTQVTGLAGLDSAGCPVVHVQIDAGQRPWRIRDLRLVAE